MKILKKLFVFLIPPAAIFLTIFLVSFLKGPGEKKKHEIGFVDLDTIISVTVYDIDQSSFNDLAAKIKKIISSIDTTFSAHRIDSELHWINRYFLRKSVSLNLDNEPEYINISPDLAALVLKSFGFMDKSNSAFSPFLFPLTRLWNIKNRGVQKEKSQRSPLPEEKDIAETLGFCSPGNSEIINSSKRTNSSEKCPDSSEKHANSLENNNSSDREESLLIHLDRFRQLDLGGLAKGLAIDRAAMEIENRGYSGIINIGGDLRCVGLPGPDRWRIGIRDRSGRGLCGVVTMEASAVATSGDYERYFEHQGKRYHHILDINTGYPAQGTASVTIGADNAVTADAAATAAFAAGADRAVETAFRLGAKWIILIDSKGVLKGPVINDNLMNQSLLPEFEFYEGSK
jgi:thiamine biosynthesis lipoprotein ApbE